MKDQIETLWKTYEAINQWIVFADAKAGFIITANGVFATILISDNIQNKDLFHANPMTLIVFILWLVFLILSTSFSILCLNPTKVKGQPDSLVFFLHISEKFNTAPEYEEAVSKAYGEDKEVFRQISNQVWAISKVAHNKLDMISWAVKLFIASVTFGLIGLVMFFILA